MARYDGLTEEGAVELVPAVVATATGGLRCIGRYLMHRGDSIPSVTARATVQALPILNGAQHVG